MAATVAVQREWAAAVERSAVKLAEAIEDNGCNWCRCATGKHHDDCLLADLIDCLDLPERTPR